ncbi:MAG: methyltransferase domain-containing protein [Cyanobacteria bacterium HKST-UBA02]|nr:methyltransferase domain-containing protein [Cyanobacteria bacterium HKST-UBA02]
MESTDSQISAPPSVNTPEGMRLRLMLLAISVLSLFLELMVIRWLSTEVRIFAYFKNLPLLSAFLGLSLGFIWWNRKYDFFKWSGISVLYLAGILVCAFPLGLTHLTLLPPSDVVMFGDFSQTVTALSFATNLTIMVLLFALTAFPFVGIGQRIGKLFQELPVLEAYGINVFGALLGVVLYSLLSFLGTGPEVWLAVAGVLFFLLERRIEYGLIIVLGIVYSVYLAPLVSPIAFGKEFQKTVWSPYYRIDLRKSMFEEKELRDVSLGTDVFINYDSFQSMVDGSEESVKRFSEPLRKQILDFHGKPFRLRDSKGSDVLVLGAGTGSDVAAALRNGAGHVDAVEIDPRILEIGKQMHPNKPYSDDRVTTYNMDARTFLKNTDSKYDFIVFGLLDSHAAFSSMSSLRTDNYIFTREAIEEACSHLKDDGIITIAFIAEPDWLWQRQVNNLTSGSGRKALGWYKASRMQTGFIAAGPGLSEDARFESPGWEPRPAKYAGAMTVCTDDWPFLFLRKPGIPPIYWVPIIAILLTGLLPVSTQFVRGARSVFNWQMFGLGAGFMLLETRAIADISLLCGSTWLVNSFIIGGVMLVIIAGTYLASRLTVRWIVPAGVALIMSLGVTTLVNCSEFSRFGILTGGLACTAVYLFPMIFSAIIFGLFFKTSKIASEALAFNLVGGILGVCLEYLGMWLGNRSLGWIAMFIYYAVILSYSIRSRVVVAAPAASLGFVVPAEQTKKQRTFAWLITVLPIPLLAVLVFMVSQKWLDGDLGASITRLFSLLPNSALGLAVGWHFLLCRALFFVGSMGSAFASLLLVSGPLIAVLVWLGSVVLAQPVTVVPHL